MAGSQDAAHRTRAQDNRFSPIRHRDGTVTFWSVYEQTWQERVGHIPERELATMSIAVRDRVLRHLAKGGAR